MRNMLLLAFAAIALVLAGHAVLVQTGSPSGSQAHAGHAAVMNRPGVGVPTTPTVPGQDAFGTIAEIVRMLDVDPKTDWSRVDVERLRQHLIDMNEVVLRAEVKSSPVPAGVAMEITGAPRTEAAIRAMVVPYATRLAALPDMSATTELIARGVRLTVTAKPPDDRAAARLRGLGFAGILTLGGHHGPYHLAIARGEAPWPPLQKP